MDRYQEAKRICERLTRQGYPTMFAGGCVRDRLSGREPKDYDIATAARPGKARRLLTDWGYRTLPLGLEHGTFVVVTPRQQIEITTLRRDVVCRGRKAEVSFTEDFAEDARRRDFTINALFEDAAGRIHDFVGGRRDLEAQRLRFVGDPSRRIREDYLRILRYFRFLARLGWHPFEDQLAGIHEHVSGLRILSAERVFHEMNLILNAPHFASVLPLMVQSGVLTEVLPWFREDAAQTLATLWRGFTTTEPVLAWSSIYFFGGPDPFPIQKLREDTRRLRFPRKLTNIVVLLYRLFSQRTHDVKALSLLLELHGKTGISTEEVGRFLERCRQLSILTFPEAIYRLHQGLSSRLPPNLPTESLLAIPARERRKVVELVKIYWYLGLCHAKNQIIQIMKHPRRYRNILESGKLQPVA